jgi:hypothetical protein
MLFLLLSSSMFLFCSKRCMARDCFLMQESETRLNDIISYFLHLCFVYRNYVVVSGDAVFIGLYVNMCIVQGTARATVYGISSLLCRQNSVLKYTDTSSDVICFLTRKCVLHHKVWTSLRAFVVRFNSRFQCMFTSNYCFLVIKKQVCGCTQAFRRNM